MSEIFNPARDYKNIEVYKTLVSKNNSSYIYKLLGYAAQEMSAKEFLDFSKQLGSVITDKKIWANLLMEADNNGRLLQDKELSGTDSKTSDYHKNLARVARLSEGADFSEWDKSQGYNSTLEYDEKDMRSLGLTNKSRKNAEKYRSGVTKVDEQVAKQIAKLRMMKDNQNS
ncbi:MAG: hypothetical protein ACOX7D_02475 [Alphaproteobacteria bacterium]|jgi:hypothetical protein